MSACGGGGGGSGSDAGEGATNNLVFQAIQVTDIDPRIGHPMDVTVSIEATKATENVSVAFFAIDKDRVNVRQLPLGERTIDMVMAGNGSYNLSLDIPTSIEIPGPYYIAALIDPLNIVEEIDEGDNEATTVAIFSVPQFPNIFIEKMDPDRSVIILDRASYNYEEQIQNGVVNSDAGGTVSFGVHGSPTPIDVEAYAVMRLMRSDTGAKHDVPLYLWNSQLGRYMNAYGVDPASGPTGVIEWLSVGQVKPQLIEGSGNVVYNDTDLVSAHLDFYFPGQLTKEIEVVLRDDDGIVIYPLATSPPPDLSISDISSLRSYLVGVRESELSSELCVEIRPSDSSVIDNIPADNKTCSSLAFQIPPLPEPPPDPVVTPYIPQWSNPTDAFYLGDSLSTGWEGDNFGYKLVFGGNASADEYGLKARGFGQLPVTVFGTTFNILDTAMTARVIPNIVFSPETAAPGFLLNVSFLDQLLYSRSLGYGNYPIAGFSVSKEKTKEKVFLIHGIVVTISGGVMGSLGVEAALNITQDELALTAAPFAKLEAIAEANANALLAEIGAEASMTLVDERIEISLGSPVIVFNDGFSGGISEVAYRPGFTLTNKLTGADGEVKAYVGVFYPTMVRCSWGILGEGYCPGTDSVRYYKNLASWTGWEKVDTLLDYTKLIDVITLQDRTVYYVTDGS